MTVYQLNAPSFLTPNVPGHRGLTPNQWAVPYQGHLHSISASHYRETNTLYVHIGCPVMLEDTVREGESVWDAIQRVVYAWQAAELENDHTEALEMNTRSGNGTQESYVKIMASKPTGERFEYARVIGDKPGFVKKFVSCAKAEGLKDVTTVSSEESMRYALDDAEDDFLSRQALTNAVAEKYEHVCYDCYDGYYTCE
jgi:hypothetical protein